MLVIGIRKKSNPQPFLIPKQQKRFTDVHFLGEQLFCDYEINLLLILLPFGLEDLYLQFTIHPNGDTM